MQNFYILYLRCSHIAFYENIELNEENEKLRSHEFERSIVTSGKNEAVF